MDTSSLLALGMGITVLYLLWDTYASGNIEQVKAPIDKREYWVQNLPDKKEAAVLLAQIRKNLLLLHGHLIKSYPDDPRVQQLKKNFNPDNIMEGEDSEKYTSYSVNKGEKIVFCIRKRNKETGDNSLVDLNTMMFVAIHEYAHVATSSTGHTKEFWDNFTWLLGESMNIGIYRRQDFKNNPAQYCGIEINSSPLDKTITIPK